MGGRYYLIRAGHPIRNNKISKYELAKIRREQVTTMLLNGMRLSHAAKQLGISRSAISRMVKIYELRSTATERRLGSDAEHLVHV